jgi:hypothetical protein
MSVASKLRSVLACSCGAFLAALLLAGSAQAASPGWELSSFADTTTASPNPALELIFDAQNQGDAPTDGSPITLTVELPPGMSATQASLYDNGKTYPCSGATLVTCTDSIVVNHGEWQGLRILAEVEAGRSGVLTANFVVSGGGAPTVSFVDPTRVLNSPPAFDIAAFEAGDVEESGATSTGAAGHPFANLTNLEFETKTETQEIRGLAWPIEPFRDLEVDLPPGSLGNPSVLGRCTLVDLAHTQGGGFSPTPECSPASQVGVITIGYRAPLGGISPDHLEPLPVFNLATPPGVPARFGFNVDGTVIVLDAHLRSSSDYGVSVGSNDAPEALAVVYSRVEFWGVPASPQHTPERACPGFGPPASPGQPTCPAGIPPAAFLRNPTSCTAAGQGIDYTIRADSWVHPGTWVSRTMTSHEAPGYPMSDEPSTFPAGYTGPTEWGPQVGIEECESEPFEPSFSAAPSSHEADSPTGLAVEVSMPQHGLTEAEAISESDLKKAVVRLPEGMTVNPSAATGSEACSAAQIGFKAGTSHPYEFDEAPNQCPDAAKIGTLELESPLLREEGSEEDRVLHGAVYLAKPQENPFGSLLAMYLVVEDEQSGTILKLPGEIEADEQTGQLETVFDENPQLPFKHLKLSLFGGPRAALKTPPACGTYTTQASFAPWSGSEAVQLQSSFKVTAGPGGGPCPEGAFAPKLEAGVENPLAGQASPFSLRLTREDGEAELTAIDSSPPPGLTGYLTGIPYCPDSVLESISSELETGRAEEAHPSCPAASQVGVVTAGAGAGANPVYTQSGRAYLAGPYNGAPLSLAVVAPAVAGPFDLGSVVVRNALRIDPETARITTVSDPLPTSLYGIPLDLRDVRVELNRPHFTLNPTSCNPMAIAATVSGTGGAVATPSTRFQLTGCESLPFKPKLSLALRGKTKIGGFPALRAVLTMPPGNANIARAAVSLPHSEFIANAHIGSPCTRVQYAAGACPVSSVLGWAKAETPLLEAPLEGPVYLMSGFGHLLPDVAADLGGQLRVFLHGKIDTGPTGGLRSTFEVVPDAPVTRFTLSMAGGKKGLLENSANLCASPHRAIAAFDAQNGKLSDSRPLVKVRCHRNKKKARHHRRDR